MAIWQINVVVTTNVTDEDRVRSLLESLLEGSEFSVASIERDFDQEEAEEKTED